MATVEQLIPLAVGTFCSLIIIGLIHPSLTMINHSIHSGPGIKWHKDITNVALVQTLVAIVTNTFLLSSMESVWIWCPGCGQCCMLCILLSLLSLLISRVPLHMCGCWCVNLVMWPSGDSGAHQSEGRALGCPILCTDTVSRKQREMKRECRKNERGWVFKPCDCQDDRLAVRWSELICYWNCRLEQDPAQTNQKGESKIQRVLAKKSLYSS